MSSLKGKTIWLIGASEGIGLALAHQLANQGATIVLSARHEHSLKKVLRTMDPGRHLILPLDVTQQNSIDNAWKTLHNHFSCIDMIIYNAGYYDPMDAQHFQLAEAEKMVNVNFQGALRVLSFILPDFIARNAGHIVLIGSVAGYRGLPRAIGYGASKAALIHLAENLKIDLANTDIVVQIINPGFVETRLTAKNSFKMPAILSTEKAAQSIVKGILSSRFEINFPKRFTLFLKGLCFLPYGLYFWIMRQIKV